MPSAAPTGGSRQHIQQAGAAIRGATGAQRPGHAQPHPSSKGTPCETRAY
jgi:hypothetical protein